MICPAGFHVEEICVADPVPAWSDLGPVPVIAANPTATGKMIVALQPFNGKLYLGYGDWDTGQQAGCDLAYWDGTAYGSVGHYATDAFWSLRLVNGELWAMVTDPEVGADPDVVVVKADGTVRLVQDSLSADTWHTFDAIAFNGGIYMAGAWRGPSGSSQATVWKRGVRADGRETWTGVMTLSSNLRVYGFGVIGTTLCALLANGIVRKTIDGTTWTTAPNATNAAANSVTSFAGQLVYLYGWTAYGAQTLLRYDGAATTIVLSGVSGICSDGTTLYALTGGTIKRTTDLTNWETVCTDAPTNGRSLAVMDGALYVGTVDSHVWRRA